MSTLNNSTIIGEIGGVEYFLIHLNDYMAYTIIYIAGTIFGILGDNLHIFEINILKTKKVHF